MTEAKLIYTEDFYSGETLKETKNIKTDSSTSSRKIDLESEDESTTLTFTGPADEVAKFEPSQHLSVVIRDTQKKTLEGKRLVFYRIFTVADKITESRIIKTDYVGITRSISMKCSDNDALRCTLKGPADKLDGFEPNMVLDVVVLRLQTKITDHADK
jgi:hypothetical protein